MGNHRAISYANLLHTLKRQRKRREGRVSSSFLRSLGGELVGFRSRHGDDRAKSAVLGMRISRRQEALGKKTGEKAQKCVIACLDYTVTLASSMARRYLSFRNAVSSLVLSFFLSLADPRRRTKPHKGNSANRPSTASLPHPSSPRLPLCSSSLSLFFKSYFVFLPSFSSSVVIAVSQPRNLLSRYIKIRSTSETRPGPASLGSVSLESCHDNRSNSYLPILLYSVNFSNIVTLLKKLTVKVLLHN